MHADEHMHAFMESRIDTNAACPVCSGSSKYSQRTQVGHTPLCACALFVGAPRSTYMPAPLFLHAALCAFAAWLCAEMAVGAPAIQLIPASETYIPAYESDRRDTRSG